MGSGKALAVGRVVGVLCVLTGRDGDAQGAMLASWVSQVSRLASQQGKWQTLKAARQGPLQRSRLHSVFRFRSFADQRWLRLVGCAQASFTPPGLTVAVKQDRAMESMLPVGAAFNLNILAEVSDHMHALPCGCWLRTSPALVPCSGSLFHTCWRSSHTAPMPSLDRLLQGKERAIMKQMLKPFKPAEDRFAGMEVQQSEATGAAIIPDAAAYLECTVVSRMDAGDHVVIYSTVDNGKVLDATAQSAVHYRRIGSNY